MKKISSSLTNFSHNFSLKLSPIHSFQQFSLDLNFQSPPAESPFDYYSIKYDYQDQYFSKLSSTFKIIWPDNEINMKDISFFEQYEDFDLKINGEINEFDQNLHKIYSFPNEEKQIIVMGVSHLLQESAYSVMNLIEKFKPDSIILECCYNRLKRIEDVKASYEKKYLKILKANPFSYKLLGKRGLEMIVAVIMSNKLQKNCQVIAGDLDENCIKNKMNEYRPLCQCQNKLLKRLRVFVGFLKIMVNSYFCKIFQKDYHTLIKLVKNMDEFDKAYAGCIEKKLSLEREINLFINLMINSNGNQRICIVGLLHLKSFDKLMKIYEEEYYMKQNNEIYEELMKNDYEFNTLEDLENYLRLCEERERNFMNRMEQLLQENNYCSEK